MLNKNMLRIFAIYLVGFFLVITMLAALLIIPKINETTKRQHVRDTVASLQLEAELLQRFVEHKVETLLDMAAFPSVTNAVLFSSSDNATFIDLMDNFSIRGEKSALMVQDLEGKIIYHTTPDTSHALRGDTEDFRKLMEGTKPYHFMLLEQKRDKMRFILSVPVTYLNSVEGLLSARIEVPMTSVFSQSFVGEHVVLKLRQNKIESEMSSGNIRIPRAFIRELAALDSELVLIQDQTEIIAAQGDLRNDILLILLIGFVVSFLAFIVLSYRTFSSDDRQFYQMSKWAYAMPIGLGVLGLAASLLAALFYYYIEEGYTHNDITNNNEQMISNLEETLKAKLDVLHYLAGLHEASDYVSRQEFKNFTQKIFNNQQDIQALKWVPIVSSEERIRIEKRTRREGFSTFQFTAMSGEGKIMPSGTRSTYYPVLYVEPLERNEAIFGLDAGTQPVRMKAMLEARQTGRPVATAPTLLTLDTSKQTAILVYHPVYKTSNKSDENVIGFVVGVFRIGDIVAKAKKGTYSDTHLLIEDITDPGKTETLYQSQSELDRESEHINIRILDMAERKVKVSAYPNPANDLHINRYLSWFVFMGGAVFSIFVSYALLQLVRRRQITESVVVERTKKVRELTDAMEKTVEGVSRINPKGDYTYLNEAFASMCGYRPEELTGKKWTITVHQDDLDLIQEAYQAMIETGQATKDLRGIRKDGSSFYKRLTMIARYNEDGLFIGHHCFMTDITQSKESELELKRSNKELDDFAYIASHDLKEPLRGIHNHAKLYIEDHESQLDEEATHRINRIIYLSQRMEGLINDLLYYSRLGRERAEFEMVDLNELVKEEQKLFLDQKNVVITLENKLPTLNCSRTRVSELFRNLITNAIKYNDSDVKKIVIGVKSATLIGSAEVPVFYVKDNGIGIELRFHKDIFKIFKRLHKRDAYGGGTGSGLTFVKKIVQQHHGDIWVESEKEKGTTFYFTLGSNSE